MKLNDIIEKLEEIYEAMLVDDEHQEALDQAIERLGELQSSRQQDDCERSENTGELETKTVSRMSGKSSFLIKSASADITFCSSYCTNTYCDRCTEGNLHQQAVDKPQARAQYRDMSRECEDFRIIRNEVVLPILSKLDSIDGIIYVCPHCHRYVAAERGIKICRICGGKVDNDNRVRYEGYVKFDGEDSWKGRG